MPVLFLSSGNGFDAFVFPRAVPYTGNLTGYTMLATTKG